MFCTCLNSKVSVQKVCGARYAVIITFGAEASVNTGKVKLSSRSALRRVVFPVAHDELQSVLNPRRNCHQKKLRETKLHLNETKHCGVNVIQVQLASVS